MKAKVFLTTLAMFFKERSVPFIRGNGKIIAQFVFGAFFIGIGIWFIKHEKAELLQISNILSRAHWLWVIAGVGLTAVYVALQGLMYCASFAAVRSSVSLGDSVTLFLKRNFISVFLPAGGVSSLAFFSNTIEKKGVKESQIYFASSIYGFVGILSVVIVAIPVFVFALFEGSVGSGEWYAFAAISLVAIATILAYRSIVKKGVVFKGISKLIPKAEVFLNDLQTNRIDRNKFLLTLFYSVLIEIVGIAHLFVAMIALNYTPSLIAAFIGYIISVIFLIVSPFLRGLGAIELSMSYCLIRLGFGNVEALAITFLYRLFEFWTPLFAGIITFLLKINKLLMRIVPALLLLCLGIVNIISVLTPAIAERLDRIANFLPIQAIHASNYLVLIAGLFLLITATFMLKGLRTAWWFALVLSVVSAVGHMTKAIDFEEAIVAFVVIIILLATRKEYYIKSNPRLRLIGLQTSVLSVFVVLLYGIIGFYFIDEKHFNINFSLIQSFKYTLQNYFLIGSNDLVPVDEFASHFLASIKISGMLSIGFLIYTLIPPYILRKNVLIEEKVAANELLKAYGNSSLDYFKTYFDKFIFFSENKTAFLAYRVTGNFAVVLENPVGKDMGEIKTCIDQFDKFCYENGLKSIYYRVPEESLGIYRILGKKYLFIGQEGNLDLSTFSLEGGAKKSIRNALKKVSDKGLKATVHTPPVKDGLLQKLKSVSDEWLKDSAREEIIFSQGMFIWEELKFQTIITVEDPEEKIIAFLNIIPDYAKGEGTYDLIRKTSDAPNGIMDFILVELFNYLKKQNYTSVNLGLAPMSGIDDPHTFPEKSMKFAYEKIKAFSHYKGLREFKEKFSPNWKNQYLVYSHDYDLLQIPSILANVIKP
ncbi:MAG TPA: bifunctional lysylphosphatidylglycerol flippase/synthetase MprF [Bacteroidales bacterium]|nr:bifunctional lysylphosphatidylglycerol flippase/synthetase MprF [Bacteroidales bacterium]